MDDLRTLLHERATPAATPSPSLVQDDLARGRTALRRHQTRRGARGALMAVAAAGVVALATQGVLGGASTSVATPPAVTASPSSAPAISLVAFTGQQPVGFTIDTVPAGWDVVRSDVNGLLLAPVGTGDRDSTDGTISLVDKIAVSQSDAATGMKGTDVGVDVGGTPGTLFTMTQDDSAGKPVASKTKTLYVEQPSGAYLAIQVWDASRWSDAQIVQLGAGIHPTDAALTTVG